ncbi:MAG: hypothetical protein ACKON8_04935, partial [Planctomycetota bacterium]
MAKPLQPPPIGRRQSRSGGRDAHAGSRIGPSSEADPCGPRNREKSPGDSVHAAPATGSAAADGTLGSRRSRDG